MLINNKEPKNWDKYAAMQFANTIATQSPKLTFDNKKVENIWQEIDLLNNLTKLNYSLVYNSSIRGVTVLGIYPLEQDNETIPFLMSGIPVYSERIGFKYIKLTIMIDLVKYNNTSYMIVEEWNKSPNEKYKFFIKRYAIDSNNQSVPLDSIEYNKYKALEFTKFETIPYAPFFANSLEQPDLFNVDSSLFVGYDNHIKILISDSLAAKALVYMNTPNTTGTAENIKNLEKALVNPETVVFHNKDIFSLLQNGGVQIQQGIFNGQGIIEKLRYYETQIKKFGFLKMQSSDLGTKNMHNSETELLNSDADDYVENKANIWEICWKQFILYVLKPFLKEFKNIELTIEEIAKIEVEVNGSTKYLQNQQNEYFQNQQGAINNPNKNINQPTGKNNDKKTDIPTNKV